MSKLVFISRDLSADNHLYLSLLNAGYDVQAVSMNETEFVPFDAKKLPATEWIFFSSKNAVEAFFAQKPDIKGKKLAAIGQGTAKSLAKYGTVTFIGQTNETAEVARAFSRKTGTDKVLFPISDRSLRSVQQVLTPEQTIDLVCYKTKENAIPVGNPDILIFTSPSNAESFLKLNKIVDFQTIIAFGKSTAAYLQEQGYDRVIISKGTSDSAILEAIKNALVS